MSLESKFADCFVCFCDTANLRHCSFLPYGAGIQLKNRDLYQLLHTPDRIRSDPTIYRCTSGRFEVQTAARCHHILTHSGAETSSSRELGYLADVYYCTALY